MPKFKSFFKLAEYKFKEQDKKLGKLLDSFLGIGVYKHCGFEHPSIDKFKKKGDSSELSNTHTKENIPMSSLR